jgi:hypothetical protein
MLGNGLPKKWAHNFIPVNPKNNTTGGQTKVAARPSFNWRCFVPQQNAESSKDEGKPAPPKATLCTKLRLDFADCTDFPNCTDELRPLGVAFLLLRKN